MDKRVIFAVAGAGKTTYILKQLNLEKRSLIITYTINNTNNLRDGILKMFHYFPSNITLMPYFTFLYSFCYKPFLSYKLKTKGITFDRNPHNYLKQKDPRYFIDSYGRVYSNRIAKLMELQGVSEDIKARLSKYFDNIFIDEVQDIAGHDFTFLTSISNSSNEILSVGDFYQHTFDTSRDGNVHCNLHEDYDKYKKAFQKMGVTVDCESLNKSYRCSPTICNFINEKLGIQIYSHNSDETKIHYITTATDADKIYHNPKIIKLFLKEHYRYRCFSRNWGDCKGEDRYGDVCVVLNKTTLKYFKKDKLKELNPQTRNKLYVACTRAKNDLYFVPDEFYKKYYMLR